MFNISGHVSATVEHRTVLKIDINVSFYKLFVGETILSWENPTLNRHTAPGPNFIIKDLPSVLIILIADLWHDSQHWYKKTPAIYVHA